MTVRHADVAAGRRAIEAAFEELQRVDEVMSLYRPTSQIVALNRDGVLDKPDPRLVEVLKKSADVSRQTHGAFDITVQPLWVLYAAAKKSGKLPGADAVAQATRKVNWRNVIVSPDRVELCGDGTAITLNAIAQGYAADRALAALRARGVENALVNTGELAAMGRNGNGAPWTVGIQHPRHPDAYVAVATLDDRCMATSGDYATTFTPDRAYNHIFDPATGRSPGDLASVTIVAPTAADADAFGTAVCVLSVEKGMSVVRRMMQMDALMVLKDGRVVATDGFPKA